MCCGFKMEKFRNCFILFFFSFIIVGIYNYVMIFCIIKFFKIICKERSKEEIFFKFFSGLVDGNVYFGEVKDWMFFRMDGGLVLLR